MVGCSSVRSRICCNRDDCDHRSNVSTENQEIRTLFWTNSHRFWTFEKRPWSMEEKVPNDHHGENLRRLLVVLLFFISSWCSLSLQTLEVLGWYTGTDDRSMTWWMISERYRKNKKRKKKGKKQDRDKNSSPCNQDDHRSLFHSKVAFRIFRYMYT